MKTEQFTLTMGITPGYDHNNENASEVDTLLADACETGIRIARSVKETTGIYLSFVLTLARVGYDHGCPVGGEIVLVFSGDRNPKYYPDAEIYASAWRLFATELKDEFQQVTATLVRQPVELEYLT